MQTVAAATPKEHSAPIPFTFSFPTLNTTHSGRALLPFLMIFSSSSTNLPSSASLASGLWNVFSFSSPSEANRSVLMLDMGSSVLGLVSSGTTPMSLYSSTGSSCTSASTDGGIVTGSMVS
uniref:Uncharacterized protein n=1 Tax=Arundo donax TaxID=35708 RepID=A0A0A9F646_ARUDO